MPNDVITLESVKLSATTYLKKFKLDCDYHSAKTIVADNKAEYPASRRKIEELTKPLFLKADDYINKAIDQKKEIDALFRQYKLQMQMGRSNPNDDLMFINKAIQHRDGMKNYLDKAQNCYKKIIADVTHETLENMRLSAMQYLRSVHAGYESTTKDTTTKAKDKYPAARRRIEELTKPLFLKADGYLKKAFQEINKMEELLKKYKKNKMSGSEFDPEAYRKIFLRFDLAMLSYTNKFKEIYKTIDRYVTSAVKESQSAHRSRPRELGSSSQRKNR